MQKNSNTEGDRSESLTTPFSLATLFDRAVASIAENKADADIAQVFSTLNTDQCVKFAFAQCKVSEGSQQGVTGCFIAAVYAKKGYADLLDRICDLPQVILNLLDFNAAPVHDDHYNQGYSVFRLSCELAIRGKPRLLEMLCGLPDTVFQTLDVNAAPQHVAHKNNGLTVLWNACALAAREQPELLKKLCELPDSVFQQFKFNAAAKLENHPSKGVSVLWYACYLAKHDQPQLLMRVCNLPDRVFDRLDFNAAPQHDNYTLKGLSVLWWACSFAENGHPQLLEKLCALPKSVFDRLDFNASPQHDAAKNKGVSVFWLACNLKKNGQPQFFQKICALPNAAFRRINFNATPQHDTNPNKGFSHLEVALDLAMMDGQPQLLERVFESLTDDQFKQLNTRSLLGNKKKSIKRLAQFIQYFIELLESNNFCSRQPQEIIDKVFNQWTRANFTPPMLSSCLYRILRQVPRRFENFSVLKKIFTLMPYGTLHYADACQSLGELCASQVSDASLNDKPKLEAALKYLTRAYYTCAEERRADLLLTLKHHWEQVLRIPIRDCAEVNPQALEAKITSALEVTAVYLTKSHPKTQQKVESRVNRLRKALESARESLYPVSESVSIVPRQ